MSRLKPKQVTGFGHLTTEASPEELQQEPGSASAPAQVDPPVRPLAAVPPPAEPAPDAEPKAAAAGGAVSAPPIGPEVPGSLPEGEDAASPPFAAPPAKTAKPRPKRGAKAVPTSNAACKHDPRRKHTINIAPDVRRRLLRLQLAETMAAGKERPLWRHVDAALAVLRADELAGGDLAVWGERAEVYGDLSGDEYQQIGTLLRGSVLTAVRTLRVRLRASGVDGVDVQAVLSAAIAAYLDALVAQGDLAEE